ncbi:MAG: chemotaxis protein CheB [Desulfobacteraceae bacterium]|nr:chemotaxis protein CheB [Desulfobacteraceae bacterium]
MQSPKEKTDQKVKKPSRSGREKAFYIAGIGASAGGLEAFEKFFKAMPENSGIGFIVVSHLDPSHVTLLPELLQKYTKMKVLLITDRLTVEPNMVYIAPPMYDLGILNGMLHLIEPMEKVVPRLCIDGFFKTLAQDRKEKAIGIILSGMGADGTAGLKEIKNELGLTVAQSPETASASSMPTSAIRTGIVDIIASPENMPEKSLLMQLMPAKYRIKRFR